MIAFVALQRSQKVEQHETNKKNIRALKARNVTDGGLIVPLETMLIDMLNVVARSTIPNMAGSRTTGSSGHIKLSLKSVKSELLAVIELFVKPEPFCRLCRLTSV